ncbi:MAG: YciI family protein, partial [Actinomycetota bacterium]
DARGRRESTASPRSSGAGDGETTPWDQMTPDQQEADMAKHGGFAEACAERDGVELLGGEALGDASTATTLRTSNGELTVTDGPFAEAAEQIGGYYVVEAADLDTVIDLCRILPPYDIEVRPVLDLG